MTLSHPRIRAIVALLATAIVALALFAAGDADAARKARSGSHTSASAHSAKSHGHSHKKKTHKKKKKAKKAKKKSHKKSAKRSTKKATTPTRKASTVTDSGAANAVSMNSGPYTTLQRTYSFGGSKLDTSAWSVYNSKWSGKPDVRRPDLVSVSDGAVHIAQRGNAGSGMCLCMAGHKQSSPYGRWEVRARAGAGSSPGFAMLLWPQAENWPAGGEIDIAEFNPARTKLLQTLHYHSSNKRYIDWTMGDYTTWHTYTVIWSPTRITWAVDGQATMTVTDKAAIPTGKMQLALQAEADEQPNSQINAKLDVAWVKVYR